MNLNKNFPYEKVSKEEILEALVAMSLMAQFALVELNKIQTFFTFQEMLKLDIKESWNTLKEGIKEDVLAKEEEMKKYTEIVNKFTEKVSEIPSEQGQNP